MKKRFRQIAAAVLAAVMLPTVGVVQHTEVRAAEGSLIRLDPSEASPFNGGEFEGWGTSLCWWANRLGYSEEMTKQAAEAFFSEEGLGLDIARYNLGGGDDPTHNHITRSDSKIPGYATGFADTVDENGVQDIVYDWTVDENQRNIALAAKAANPDLYFEGFSNSPPYFMTNSGCSSGAEESSADNLNPEYYDEFAKFIAQTTLKFKNDFGIEFKSYSPMNEPDTAYWGANSEKQEGAHYSPGEVQSNTIVATRTALDRAGLTDVLVAGMDENDIGKTITNYGKLTDEAKAALGRIDTHTYNGSNRAGAKATAVNAEKDLWMSEVDGGWNGIGLAQRIILDMNGMQPSAWVLWDIVDFHKDSNFTDPNGSKTEANNSLNAAGSMWGMAMGNHDEQKIELANKYYFYGQFTKYINPGDTVIASSDTSLAAYNKKTGDIKIVALNSGTSAASYVFDMSAFRQVGKNARVIRTNNSDEKWADLGTVKVEDKKIAYTLPPQSLTTFVVESDTRVNTFNAGETGLSYSYTVPESLEKYNKYFTVYNSENELVYISLNQKSAQDVAGNFKDCTFKLYVWDENNKPVIKPCGADSMFEISNDYAIIKGGGSQIKVGDTAALSVNTNIEGDIVWSVSDESVAQITQEGTVKALTSGSFTVYAAIGDLVVSKSFEVPKYDKITGTASWGNASNRPADSADYTQVADGDLTTFFDGLQNGYVQYDYGAPFKISAVKLAPRSESGYESRTVGAVVQGSNDAETWTDLYKITSALDVDTYTTITADELENNSAYRYFRYTNPDDYTNIAEFLIEGDFSDNVAENEPTVTDIAEFTDDFESSTNIFGAEYKTMSDGNVVFDTALARFGNAFAPVKSTAEAVIAEERTLTEKDMFRLTFDMFAGWENGGKDNTFALKDSDGKELVAIYITGGGYTLNQVRINGSNVLENTTVAQCRSNPGTSKAGANGWGASGQPFVNTVGYNKNVQITVSGTGMVKVSLTGGMEDTTVEGTVNTPVKLGKLELTGNYNSAASRTVSYDNFDADIITYCAPLATPAPTAEPTPSPEPTEAPVIPENGELINLNFDSADLASTSSYGIASGSPEFVTIDEKACAKFGNTAATAIKLTDKNGNSLLSGIDEFTVSFKVKPTSDSTSWLFYAAPNDNTQTYLQEKYIGAMTSGGKIVTERYNNNGARSESISASVTKDEWNDVMIVVSSNTTAVYINGERADEKTSAAAVSDILGDKSVVYIGRANWGNGEYATGYIDDFVIRRGVLTNPLADIDLGDLSAVTENITVPAQLEDGTQIEWTTSNADVLTTAGAVVRGDDTQTVTLTASVVSPENGIAFSRTFEVTVLGYAAVINTFAAYSEENSIIFTSEYTEDELYDMHIVLYDYEDNAVGEEIQNTAGGRFDELDNGTYKIVCSLTNEEGAEVRKVEKTIKVKEQVQTEAYLFAHFVGTESSANDEQIYFSVSTDGTEWKTLQNDSKPILTSTVGELGGA